MKKLILLFICTLFCCTYIKAQQKIFYLEANLLNNIKINDLVCLNDINVISNYSQITNAFGNPIFENNVAIGIEAEIESKDLHYDGMHFLYFYDGDDLILEHLEIVKPSNFVRLQGEAIKVGDDIDIIEYLYEDLFKNPSVKNINGNNVYSFKIHFINDGGVLYFYYDNNTKKIIKIGFVQRTT